MCVIMEAWDTTYEDYNPDSMQPDQCDAIDHMLYNLIYDTEKGIFARFYSETGMIHGDAHPGNILLMLDDNGYPVRASLIDFECSCDSTASSLINSLYPGYDNFNGSIQNYESMRVYSLWKN